MQKFFFAALVSFSFFMANAESASANLDGKWTGWGAWNYDGTDIECPAMSLAFSEDAQTLQRIRGFFDCHIVTMEIPDLEFQKEGQKLFLEGSPVGSWSDSDYSWTEVYNEKFIIKVSISVQGQSMTYHEVWKSKEDEILYDIQGRLFRSEESSANSTDM
ncbi:MAG: hypothetical protein ACAH59_02375 [Pseudobdellovibrionaceae bacterium]